MDYRLRQLKTLMDSFNMDKVYFENIFNKDGFYQTVWLENTLPATSTNYPIFFIAMKPCEVMMVSEVHGTASTSGTVQVEKLTGITAKGSGSNVLVTAFSTASTANTVQTKTGDLLQNRTMNVGDRLALKAAGTLTNSANMCVTLYLRPLGKGDYR